MAAAVGQALSLDVPRPVQVPLDEALAPAEGRDGLADGGLELRLDLVVGPRDLEPAPAAAIGGLDRDRQPCSRANFAASAAPETGPWVPGASGAPTVRAIIRAAVLSPSASIAAGGGPIQVRPAAITSRAKWAFSARKP